MFLNHFTLSQVKNPTLNSTLNCQYLTLFSLFAITRYNLIVMGFCLPLQRDLKPWAHRIEDTDSLNVDLCYYLFHSPL